MRWYRVSALMLAAVLLVFASQANSAVVITVDKATQRMSVVVDGELRWSWPVSTGLTKYDTPNGSFTTFRMVRDHYSREWDDAPMPHSIFFTRFGHAIHGTSSVRRLGRAASHGCVRLAPQNAAKLFSLVRQHGLANTQVVIAGALPSSLPVIAVPLPRERRAAVQQLAKLETPAEVRRDAVPAAPAPAARSETASIATVQAERPPEESSASARTVPLPRERLAVAQQPVKPEAPVAAPRDASPTAAASAESAAVATLQAERPVEQSAATARLIPAQPERNAGSPVTRAPEPPAAAASEAPTVADAEPGQTVAAARSPEAPAVERRVSARAVPVPRERAATPSADADMPAPRQAAAVEPPRQQAAVEEPPRQQAKRALPRPRALPEPPPRRQATREPPPRREARVYDEPPAYRRPRAFDRPPVYQRRDARLGPRVYYDPRVEVIEETYINGHWVRRRYYRQAVPRDFYGYR